MTATSIAAVAGLEPFVQLGAFTSGIPVPGSAWDAVTWDAPEAIWEGGHGYIDPPWTDITCDVNAVEINTGRDRSIDRWQVGNATLTLNNASGWADVLPWSNDSLAFEVRPGPSDPVRGQRGRWRTPLVVPLVHRHGRPVLRTGPGDGHGHRRLCRRQRPGRQGGGGEDGGPGRCRRHP